MPVRHALSRTTDAFADTATLPCFAEASFLDRCAGNFMQSDRRWILERPLDNIPTPIPLSPATANLVAGHPMPGTIRYC